MTPKKKQIAPFEATSSPTAHAEPLAAQVDLSKAAGHESQGQDDWMEEEERENEKKRKAAEFALMLEGSFSQTKKRVSPGDRIKAEVLSIGKEEIFVSTGTMHDGVVRRQELTGADGQVTVQVGDRIDLYVTQVRGSEIYLSTKAMGGGASEDLEDAFDKMLPVEGRVVELCKGGFRVSVLGKLAFCPISQMDSKRIETPEEYVGQRFEFLITQLTERGRNVVVSRRKLLDEQKSLSQAAFAEEHHAGEVISGRITKLERFGAFVEIQPGLEGLVHISELAWSRIADPKDVVHVGQEVQVKILKIESLPEGDGRLKISLSLKQASGDAPEARAASGQLDSSDPWAAIAQKFPVGTVVAGTIQRKEAYGIFVQLADGVVGLLPKSKAREDAQFHFEKARLKDTITVQVDEIRPSERRISLGFPKDEGEREWRTFAAATSASSSFGTLGDQFKALMDKKGKVGK